MGIYKVEGFATTADSNRVYATEVEARRADGGQRFEAILLENVNFRDEEVDFDELCARWEDLRRALEDMRA